MNRKIALRSRRWPARLGACALTAALCLTILPLAASAGQEVTVDGVIHVKNPATPPQGVETMQLEELWRAGGAGEDATVFGVILQALTDEEGNLYLLDLQLSQVFVYSPEGKLLRTLSREGEGPGEVRNPTDMFFMADGSLGLVQTFPGKVVKLKLDNTPAGTLEPKGADGTAGGILVIIDGDWRGGNLVFAGMNVILGNPQSQQTRKSFLAGYGEDGVEKARYWEKSQFMDLANLHLDEGDQYNVFPRRWDIAANGDVYVATDRNQYSVSVFAPDGTLKRVIEREFTNRKRTDDEMALYRRLVDAQMAQLPGQPQITIGERPEAIQLVEIVPDGTVWVVSSYGNHEQPTGIMTTYDVFDAQGNYTKQVAVACPGDGKKDGLIRVGRDRMLLITGFVPAVMSMQGGGAAASGEEEPAPMEVVCYKIRG
jgi:hypothetical protein